MISDISHQTVTPLSNIMIYSQLLEEELAGTAQEEKVQAIGRQAEKLDFLLKLSRQNIQIETGIIKTQSKENDLWELMESVCEQGRQKAVDKDIDLVFERGENSQPLCAISSGREKPALIFWTMPLNIQQGVAE